MTKDLPDFLLEVVSAAVEATAFRSGLDADKPASPAAGDIWLARDTYYLYVCFVAGSWEKVAKLYLPLAGGIMTGAIAMGTNSITGLPSPTGSGHATRKSYVDAAALDRSKVIWKASPAADLELDNRTATIDWTALDLTGATSADAKLAILDILIYVDSISSGAFASVLVRKNDDTPSYMPTINVAAANGDEAGAVGRGLLICGLDSGQVLEYRLAIGGTIQVDARITVLGYVE